MALAAAINMPYGKVAILEDHEFTIGFLAISSQPIGRKCRGTPVVEERR
jgi:hypothetical protein